MIRVAGRALVVTLILVVLTGVAYPLVVTGVAQIAFPDRADGSLVRNRGRIVGSSLVGQAWKGDRWFYGRPSAIGYDAATSGGTNLGPASEELTRMIRDRAQEILDLEGSYRPGITVDDIPPDLLLASASGLDPDISPAAAAFQAPRIAAVRGCSTGDVHDSIRAATRRPPFGLFGAPRVNVLSLNRALEAIRCRGA